MLFLWKRSFLTLNPFVAIADINPCQPSPCGPNSQCREINGQAVCSCAPSYIGSPPGCRPECVVSSECSIDKACVNQKCTDPCPGICGTNANCRVNNHSPICSCQTGYTGNPFTRCYVLPRKSTFVTIHKDLNLIFNILFYSTSAPQQDVPAIINPCVPSPCGPRSQCQAINNVPSCSCLTDSFGSPPNCRPECTINSDCTSNKACINEKCKDPCPGACGFEARCNVINHTPTCTCNEGYIGDSFSSCHLKPPPRMNKRKPFIFLNSVTY